MFCFLCLLRNEEKHIYQFLELRKSSTSVVVFCILCETLIDDVLTTIITFSWICKPQKCICPYTWHIYIVYNILYLNISSIYISGQEMVNINDVKWTWSQRKVLELKTTLLNRYKYKFIIKSYTDNCKNK